MSRIRITSALLAALAGAAVMLHTNGPVHAEPPVIKDFSSTGGQPRNKDNAGDKMYLVKPGDKITFQVKAENAEKYEWQLNKKVQKEAKGNSLIWTVPNEKGTWEIHVKVSNKDGQIHQEWVISTLTKAEAPDLFDYFSDRKVNGRTGEDPWGRPLPEWNTKDKGGKIRSDASKAFLTGRGLSINSDIAHGTWRCRVKCDRSRKYTVRYPNQAAPGFPRIHGDDGRGNKVFWNSSPSDSIHWYFGMQCGFLPGIGGSAGSAWGWIDLSKETFGAGPMHFWIPDEQWHMLTVMYSKDGWFRTWVDESIVPGLMENSPWLKNAKTFEFNLRWAELDCIEVYKDRYVYPVRAGGKRAVYRKYVDHWKAGGGTYCSQPVYDEGIVVEGNNVRLSEIAELVNDKSKFRYDPRTKTADCYTNLVIWGGSELILENETLRMHCKQDGQHRIRVKTSTLVRLVNSTVTSADRHHYLWAFTGLPLLETHKEEAVAAKCTEQKGQRVSQLYYCDSRFVMENSTINNCGNFSLCGPLEVVIKNSRFTNLVNAEYGDHGAVKKDRAWYHGAHRMVRGKKAVLIYNRLPVTDFRIENVLFQGKSGAEPAKVIIIGGEPLVSDQRLVNAKFSNATLTVKRGIKEESHFQYERRYFDAVVSLVNSDCKDVSLDLKTSYDAVDKCDDTYIGARKSEVVSRYFLDVKVVDRNGRPIPNATVVVTNEIDDVRCPSENLLCMYREPEHGVQFFGHARQMRGSYDPAELGGYPWFMRRVKAVIKPAYFIEALKQGRRERQLRIEGIKVQDEKYDDKKRLIGFCRYAGYSRMGRIGYSQKGMKLRNLVFKYDIDDISYYGSGLLKSYRIKGWYTADGKRTRPGKGLAWYIYEFQYNLDKMGNVLSYKEIRRDGEHKHHPVICTREVVVAAVTGKDGHTPLPSDGKHTLVIADYKLDRNNAAKSLTKTDFTHTIEVYADGLKKKITGVNPGPQWYRPDPNKANYTITVVMEKGSKAESEGDLRKKGLAGRPRK